MIKYKRKNQLVLVNINGMIGLDVFAEMSKKGVPSMASIVINSKKKTRAFQVFMTSV